MNNCYLVRIVFIKAGEPVEEQVYKRVVDRSPQGAIVKAFHQSRIRNGSNGKNHGNYGCEKLSVEVECLGRVE